MNCVERYISVWQSTIPAQITTAFQGEISPDDMEALVDELEAQAMQLAQLQIVANADTEDKLAPFLVDENSRIRKLAELRYEEIRMVQT